MNEKALLYLYGWIEGTIGERLFSFEDFKLAASRAVTEEWLLSLVENPPPPSPELVHAWQRYNERKGPDNTFTLDEAPPASDVAGSGVLAEPVKEVTWQPLKRGRGNNFSAGAKIRLKSDWKEICESNSYGVALENIEYDNTVIIGEEYIVESYVDDGSLSVPLQLDLSDEYGNQIDQFWTEYELWEILR